MGEGCRVGPPRPFGLTSPLLHPRPALRPAGAPSPHAASLTPSSSGQASQQGDPQRSQHQQAQRQDQQQSQSRSLQSHLITAATLLPALPPPPPGGNGDGDGGEAAGPQPLADVAAQPPEVVLTLASFAVTKLAYVRVTRAFREWYERTKGVDVRFRLTFAASGVQVCGWGCLGWGGRGAVGLG